MTTTQTHSTGFRFDGDRIHTPLPTGGLWIRSSLAFGLALACILSLSAGARADDVFWEPPGGGSSSWTDGGNWFGGSAPVDDTITDTAVFSGTVTYEHQPALDVFTVQSVNGVRIGGAGTVAVELGTNEGIRTTDGSTPGNSTTIEMSDVSGLAVGATNYDVRDGQRNLYHRHHRE
ncbi:MAG: hypothetical protein PF795_05635, partial [Kiritimatiellae bacterium]|nr:hypothetical protein [Kiritimatiellia bacterium]